MYYYGCAHFSSGLQCGPAATAQTSSGSDFAKLCGAIAAKEGKISREQFIAKAKDKEAAAQLFDACDDNHDKIITEKEATPKHMKGLKRQVIRGFILTLAITENQ